MLIRSQDKLDVIIVENASRISIEKSQNGFPIRTRSFKETWFLLGFYKSNETALKVLAHQLAVADDLWPGVLRHRDDGHAGFQL